MKSPIQNTAGEAALTALVVFPIIYILRFLYTELHRFDAGLIFSALVLAAIALLSFTRLKALLSSGGKEVSSFQE